jgi:ATP-dependent 26S proteasome regulatory subunit
MSLQRGINLRALAEKMGQCSGAEVRGICTEAGLCSALFFPTFDKLCNT